MGSPDLQKKNRVVDPELLAEVRKLPCIACITPIAVEAHHVTTVGAGGDDVPENVMPLCFTHHRGGSDSWHRDPGRFIRKFPSVRYWLEIAGREDILDRYRSKPPATG